MLLDSHSASSSTHSVHLTVCVIVHNNFPVRVMVSLYSRHCSLERNQLLQADLSTQANIYRH